MEKLHGFAKGSAPKKNQLNMEKQFSAKKEKDIRSGGPATSSQSPLTQASPDAAMALLAESKPKSQLCLFYLLALTRVVMLARLSGWTTIKGFLCYSFNKKKKNPPQTRKLKQAGWVPQKGT